jgi:hypothetical protein
VKSALKLLLVCAMLALVPLRGIAAVTVGICAVGEHGAWAQVHADDGHGTHDDPSGPESGSDDNPAECGVCAEHCAGASFVIESAPASLADWARAERSLPGERFAAGHVPEHLDPPPLAL